MVGELAVSFCERKAGQVSTYLDLWSYPDGTYNLVIENFGGADQQELSFPCAFHQLAGVLGGKPLISQNESGMVVIDRCGNSVCAEFQPFDSPEQFRHCIPLEEYRHAIDALESNVIGYLA
jgi:hypothetical protein